MFVFFVPLPVRSSRGRCFGLHSPNIVVWLVLKVSSRKFYFGATSYLIPGALLRTSVFLFFSPLRESRADATLQPLRFTRFADHAPTACGTPAVPSSARPGERDRWDESTGMSLIG